MQAAIQTDIEAGRGPADATQYGRPSAGGNQDTDNEGAIDTGDDSPQQDNSGAAPVMGGAIPGEDNSGAAPVMPPSPQGGAGDHFTPNLNPADVPGNMKRIVSYLMGSDAAPPQALDQAGQQVDPQGQMSPGDRNLVAIDKAAETGGQAAAWKLLQANRVAFNAKQAFARTAMRGVQGKPADINAAIDAANQAEQHIPDGSNVKFARSQNGVTATVTMPGTSQPQQIQLTPEQFDKWLDVGGDGQWDKVHQNSVPATLQRLSQAGGQSAMSKVTGVPDKGPPAGSVGMPEPQPKTNVGKTPSSLNLSGSDEQQAPTEDKTGYGDELEQRALKVFPGITQNSQRQQWMAAQEEKELARQNQVEVAAEKGKWADQRAKTAGGFHVEGAKAAAGGRVEAAKLYSGAKLEAAKAANAAKLKQLEQSGANKQEEGQRKLLQTYLVTGQQPPQHLQKYIDNGTDSALAAQAGQPQQRPAAPAQPAQPAAQMSAHDQQAAAWAKANPNDPRAAQIMQKLGAQ